MLDFHMFAGDKIVKVKPRKASGRRGIYLHGEKLPLAKLEEKHTPRKKKGWWCSLVRDVTGVWVSRQ